MGWNTCEIIKNHKILDNIPQNTHFYFVHSYFVECEEEETILMNTEYSRVFCSAVQKKNIFGFQFHPEKSHDLGWIVVNNFIKHCLEC